MVQIKAPQFPESIADGEVATWHLSVGESARRDQILVDIETDKVVLEVVAPADGTLTAIHKAEGDTVLTEEVLGEFEPGEVTGASPALDSAALDEPAASADVVTPVNSTVVATIPGEFPAQAIQEVLGPIDDLAIFSRAAGKFGAVDQFVPSQSSTAAVLASVYPP